MDTVSTEVRSRIMAAIKSKGTKCEEAVFYMLKTHRGMIRNILGADMVYLHRKVAIRVHGCFFHYCPAHGTIPKTRREFWRKKFIGNVNRDARVRKDLRSRGFKIIDIWEHDVTKRPHVVAARLRRSGL